VLLKWSPDHTRKSAGLMVSAFLGLIAFLILPFATHSAPANKRAVAVIIGNTNYQSRIPSVDFAGNDADAFRKFVINALGYDPENIIDLRDATKAQMETAFGNHQTFEGKLWRYIDPNGRSDVTIFYSGHGVPGLKDKRGYLLPVDADAETPEINGFSVDTLLGNLGKLKTRSTTVFLDACFSGDSQKGMLVKGTSGISITPRLPTGSKGMTIITAAQGDQVASWDYKAKQGLFTKHLLDALYGNADGDEYGNSDGKVELSEVRKYLDDRMTRAARRQYGRHQNVWISGDELSIPVNLIPVSTKSNASNTKPVPASNISTNVTQQNTTTSSKSSTKVETQLASVANSVRNFDGTWQGNIKYRRHGAGDVESSEEIIIKILDGKVAGSYRHYWSGQFLEDRKIEGEIDSDGNIVSMVISGMKNGYDLQGTLMEGTGKSLFGGSSWEIEYEFTRSDQ